MNAQRAIGMVTVVGVMLLLASSTALAQTPAPANAASSATCSRRPQRAGRCSGDINFNADATGYVPPTLSFFKGRFA